MVAVNLLVGCQTLVLALDSPADVRAALGKLGDASIEHATITFTKPLTCVQELIACATPKGASRGTEVFALQGSYYAERVECIRAVSAGDAEEIWARIAATTGCPVVHVLGAHRSYVLSTAALPAPTWELAVYVDPGGCAATAVADASAEGGDRGGGASGGSRGTSRGGERAPPGGRSPHLVVAVASTDTVMDLKARIHALFGALDPWDAVVAFGGTELADLGDLADPAGHTSRPTLQTLGLSDGASITLLRVATDLSAPGHLAPTAPAARACGVSAAGDGAVVVVVNFRHEKCTVVVKATDTPGDVLTRLAREHEHLREAVAASSHPRLVCFCPRKHFRTRSIPLGARVLDHVGKDGHPPELRLQSGEPVVQVFAKTMQGCTKTLNVRLSDWVDDVRRTLAGLEGVPPAHLRMVMGGRQLEDGGTLGDYDCQAFATVHVVMRLRGGMHHASSLRRNPGVVEGGPGVRAGCEPNPPGKRLDVHEWAQQPRLRFPLPAESLAGLRMSVHVVRPDLPIGATGAAFQGFACGAASRAAPGRAPVQVPGTKHHVHFGPSGVTSGALRLQQHKTPDQAFATFDHLLANVGEALCGLDSAPGSALDSAPGSALYSAPGSALDSAPGSAPPVHKSVASLELVWRVAQNIFRSHGTTQWEEVMPLLQAFLPGRWDADAVRDEWTRRSAHTGSEGSTAPAASVGATSSCTGDAGDSVAGATD